MSEEQTVQDRLLTEVAVLRRQVQTLQDVALKRPERVIIFIDNTNLNFTARKIDSTGQYRLCYNKLRDYLANNRLMRQCRIYYSDFGRDAVLSSEEQGRRQEREGFYGWLKWQGFWLKSCNLVDRGDGTAKEKGLDAAITKDIERLASNNACDTIVLVAGDADYRELVSDIQSHYGLRVEVAFFPEFTAKSLQYAATEFIDLSKVKDALRRST